MVLESLATIDASRVFAAMNGLNILVIGDIMLDEWIWGVVSRISPEAPVPVVAVNNHSFTLGGAGNVANNLRAVGARVSFAGVVGDDVEGDRVLRLLEDLGVNHELVVRLSDRPTTRKTRVVAHSQQVVRADWESSAPLSRKDAERVKNRIAAVITEYDAVVLSDYAKGLLSRELVEVALAAPVTVADPKPKNLTMFRGVTCVAPNVHEAQAASGIEIADDASLAAAGTILLERLGCEYVVVTRGERGMALFGKDGVRRMIPSVARTVFDVSGAGDTVVAVLTLALAAKAPIGVALELANVAAGAVVEKLGTATASPDEIMALLTEAING
jgi:D-beta-D-heptose 7-phosphate kinase/D-beta-D-heptose 1-phosphate adenosyltransferase